MGRGCHRPLRSAPGAGGRVTGRQPVCLLSGAGSSFGEAFCEAFRDRYRIAALWHRRSPAVGQVGRGEVLAVQADLLKPGEVQRAVQAARGELGDIDIVVNATGYRRWRDFADDDDLAASLAMHMDLNVRVPIEVTLAVFRQCWAGRRVENQLRHRCAVNVSSTAGSHVYAGWGQGCYSASKAALNLASGHLATELISHGVRVNVIAPNTFPGIVSWKRLFDGVQTVLETSSSGRILVLDKDHSSWLCFDGSSAAPEAFSCIAPDRLLHPAEADGR